MGEDFRSALGTWPMENGQPVEYRKRMLDSDDDEEIRDLPEKEQRLARRTKVLRRYAPTGSGQTPGGGREEQRGNVRLAGCACGCSEGSGRQGRQGSR